MMSDRVPESDHTDGTCKKLEHVCESSWIARWTRLDSASTAQDQTHCPVKPENVDECNKMILSGRSEIGTNESFRKTKSFPMFNIFQQKESLTDLKNVEVSRTAAAGIFAGSDSSKETSRMHLLNPRATDRFLTTEKTDVNESMKLKGKSCCDFLNLFPDLGSRHQQGAKLHLFDDGTTADEEQERLDGAKKSTVCIKNESSAETDILDVDYVQKNRLSGIAPSASNKAVKRKQRSFEIPDMNQEPPVVPDKDDSSKDSVKQASSSKTQSLNMDHFVSNIGDLFSEPGYRWVKRLKTSASSSTGHGTKSSSTEQDVPSEKVNDFLTRIMKCRNPSSEERNLKTLVKNSKDEDITLLHPWIQRWCQDKQSSRTTETEVVCEPRKTKDGEFQKKQFPSIAAMALMGKALNGFSPSELRKRGSLHVWRTRNIM